MNNTPTRELEAPQFEVEGGQVEWHNNHYKLTELSPMEKEKECIDEEMNKIRSILKDTKVLGVNHFPKK